MHMVGCAYIYDVISDDIVEVHRISSWLCLKEEKDYRIMLENKEKWNQIFSGKKRAPKGKKKKQYAPDFIIKKEDIFKGINARSTDEHELCADMHFIIDGGVLTEYVRGKKYYTLKI